MEIVKSLLNVKAGATICATKENALDAIFPGFVGEKKNPRGYRVFIAVNKRRAM